MSAVADALHGLMPAAADTQAAIGGNDDAADTRQTVANPAERLGLDLKGRRPNERSR